MANLEYLKNVLLQFIFLKSGSEKERLLPVIDTMLQLSPEEKGKLVAIAQGIWWSKYGCKKKEVEIKATEVLHLLL